jgi:hypothetical protein
LSLSRELVGAVAQELRCLPKITTVSKQEAVRLLASDIEALRAHGNTYRDVLSLLQERGLEIASVETLKNYLHRAKRRAGRQVNASVVKSHALHAAPPPPDRSPAAAGTDDPQVSAQHAPAPAPTTPEHMAAQSTPTLALSKRPGWFTPVLHTVDDDV